MAGTPQSGSAAPRDLRHLISRYVPILVWLPEYPRSDLRADVVAGLISWAVMVPVSLAYAGLAGMPAEIGLVTAFAALAAYAVFGTSRHLRVTTSSTMAILSASVVAPLAGDPVVFLALTATLALIVGAILIAAGLLRLGFLADFLSKPVVTGFVIGLAITIIIGQIPKLLGYPTPLGSVAQQVLAAFPSLAEANPWSAALGVGSLLVILALKRLVPRLPGALIALLVGVGLSVVLDLAARGVAVVGEVSTGVPLPGLPHIAFGQLAYLVTGAAGLVILAGGESIGAARTFASRHHYRLDADQELVALGAANVGAGLFGGFAVDASISQTVTGEAAGTRSQLSSLLVAALMLMTAIVLAPVFKDLPQPTLAAIVIAAVLSLIDLRELKRYYDWRRTDLLISVVAIVGVLTTDVLTGLIIAAALSLTALLYRASRPDIVVLGRFPGAATFGDIARHPDAVQIDGVLIVRVDTPLYFFNAQEATSHILREVSQRPGTRFVAIALGATGDLDVTATDLLAELYGELRRQGITVILAQVKGILRDRLRRTGLMTVLGEEHIYQSIAEAVAAIEADVARPATEPA